MSELREILEKHQKGGQHANLQEANLRGASLGEIKEDFFSKLIVAKSEVAGLYDALMRGRIDGALYQGECASAAMAR